MCLRIHSRESRPTAPRLAHVTTTGTPPPHPWVVVLYPDPTPLIINPGMGLGGYWAFLHRYWFEWSSLQTRKHSIVTWPFPWWEGHFSWYKMTALVEATSCQTLPLHVQRCDLELLSYCPTVLLSYCPTVLLSYCPTGHSSVSSQDSSSDQSSKFESCKHTNGWPSVHWTCSIASFPDTQTNWEWGCS